MIYDDLQFMPPTTSFMFDDRRHQERMDRRYRYQRFIFDLTRKFILLGRERAITALRLQDARSALEIGCGTGRNLKLMADRHPALRLIGIDISGNAEVGAPKIARARLDDRVTLQQGDAAGPTGRKAQRILMSYSLSMVPDWQRARRRDRDAEAGRHPGDRRFRRPAGLARGALHRHAVAPRRTALPRTAAGVAPSRIVQRPHSAPRICPRRALSAGHR
jgi:SAM-dependent methyltransferase